MEVMESSSDAAAEASLAHEEPDKTKKTYARSKLLKLRVTLLQTWADYVLPRSADSGER